MFLYSIFVPLSAGIIENGSDPWPSGVIIPGEIWPPVALSSVCIWRTKNRPTTKIGTAAMAKSVEYFGEFIEVLLYSAIKN
jgi:hypothetical protein